MRTTKADPIIAEVRAVRDEHAARFDDDIDAIFRDIRAAQEMYFINSTVPGTPRARRYRPRTGFPRPADGRGTRKTRLALQELVDPPDVALGDRRAVIVQPTDPCRSRCWLMASAPVEAVSPNESHYSVATK